MGGIWYVTPNDVNTLHAWMIAGFILLTILAGDPPRRFTTTCTALRLAGGGAEDTATATATAAATAGADHGHGPSPPPTPRRPRRPQ